MRIDREEFSERITRIQDEMGQAGLNAVMVYGDEYRKENLRYVCNFWPIFERGACFIPVNGEPVFAGAPEGEKYAAEMCVWRDIRNVKEFACVSVPEEIDYPLAKFSSFREILGDVLRGGRKLGVAGIFDMPEHIVRRLKTALPGLDIVNAGDIINSLRIIKTPSEIECLRKAGEFQTLMEASPTFQRGRLFRA